MGREFLAASTQHLVNDASAPVTAMPLTMAIWMRPSTVSGTHVALFLGDKDVSNQSYRIGQNGTAMSATIISSLANQTFGHGATISVSTWYHIAVVFTSNVSRTPYVNGVAGTTATTDVTPINLDRVNVGRFGRSAPADYFSGTLAEAGIWSVALTAGEIAALAAGVSPARIRPEALGFYSPIHGINDPEPDLTAGGRDLTVTSAPPFAQHAPVQPFMFTSPQPSSQSSGRVAATVAGKRLSRQTLLGAG